ncbi:MAG: glycosyltransferase [Candidatus Aenigmatarchaeota archaeon]
MKICMITSYEPDRCGISDYSERLAGSLRKAGAEVIIISREGQGAKGEKNIHRIVAVKKVKRSFSQIFEEFASFSRTMKDVNKSMEIIGDFGSEVVHVQYEPGLYNLFYVPMLLSALRKRGIKVVLTLHAIDYFPLTIFHKTFLYNKPDKIIVHTRVHEEIIKKSLKSAKRIELVPMGLIPRRPGRDGNYILYFGFLNQHKGVEDLIEAFGKIKCREKLVVIGSINPVFRPDVEYKDKIKRMINDLGLKRRVNFIYKFVPQKSLTDYIRNCMFVVFPYRSSYSGAQSQATIDVLASGKPMIVTKPAQGNLVDNENAIVIEPDNVEILSAALEKMIKSKDLRKRIAKNNKDLAKELNWDKIAYITLIVYENL